MRDCLFNVKEIMRRSGPEANKKKLVSCVLVGDTGVGKSVLSLAFARHCFPVCDRYEATVFENLTGAVSCSETQYTVNIFDTSGEHNHLGVRNFCYDKSEICITTYSVGDRRSFNNAKEFWIPEAKKRMKSSRSIILVGCQSDVRHLRKNGGGDLVTYSEGLGLAEESGIAFFQECSSRLLVGVREVFENVVTFTLKRRKRRKGFRARVHNMGKGLTCTRPRTDTI